MQILTDQITIISARWIVPVEPHGMVLDDHAVVIQSGDIIDLCTREKALQEHPEAEHIARPNHLIIPGLINAHTHAGMSLFRGLADDMPLMDWLSNHIWPAEAKWIDTDFMRDGTQLAIAEMLLSGTTCFNDMYFYPNIVGTVAQDAGIRASVGMIILDFPSVWAADVDEYFEKGVDVHHQIRSLSRIQTTIAPHAPYTVSDAPLEQALTYADELEVPIHMHVHETATEIADSISQFGKRPLARLNELGLLNPRMMAVHMTQLDNDEIDLVAKQGVHVVHCPESNQKLASGMCRVSDLVKAGVNVCLGTDSASSNNDLDMLGEMRSAALLAKTLTNDAATLSAADILRMATLNGAIALNQDAEIGSLIVGKSADLVAIDLNHVSTQPVYDPIAQLVYSASRDQVSDVWVRGRQLVTDAKLNSLDSQQILKKATEWGAKINMHRQANMEQS